jgi:hypothetical protein
MKTFYTYAFLREDKTPYYIGKGTNKRIKEKRQRCCNLPIDKSRIIILKQNLSEEEAFRHEVYLIAIYGRKDLGTGILHNRTNGGEGISGHKHSEKTRAKMSAAKKGKEFSPEHRAKLRDAAQNFSQEHRDKLSAAQKGKPKSAEARAKMSAAKKGRQLSNEHKSNISKGKKRTTSETGTHPLDETSEAW